MMNKQAIPPLMPNALSAIHARVQEVQTELSRFGYKPFPIVAKIAVLKFGIAGTASYNSNTINISPDFLREFPERVLKETVAHEVCHLYVGMYKRYARQHHGPEFRYFMNLLGLRGDTKHSMVLKATKTAAPNARTKTRYLYATAHSNRKVHLTPMQHRKHQMMFKRNPTISFYTSKGEALVYTGKVLTFK